MDTYNSTQYNSKNENKTLLLDIDHQDQIN